jgi:hypothetical protein
MGRKPVQPLWKMGPNTKPMCLNESEFDVWMKRFGDWLEGNNLDCLLVFNNDILVLDSLRSEAALLIPAVCYPQADSLLLLPAAAHYSQAALSARLVHCASSQQSPHH